VSRTPKIQLLHTDGCDEANTDAAREALRVAMAGLDLDFSLVEEVLIADEEQSVAYNMVGGPAIMVDGVDVDPNVRGMRSGGLGCRAYITPQGITAAPPLEMIVAALEEAMGSDGDGSHTG